MVIGIQPQCHLGDRYRTLKIRQEGESIALALQNKLGKCSQNMNWD